MQSHERLMTLQAVGEACAKRPTRPGELGHPRSRLNNFQRVGIDPHSPAPFFVTSESDQVSCRRGTVANSRGHLSARVRHDPET